MIPFAVLNSLFSDLKRIFACKLSDDFSGFVDTCGTGKRNRAGALVLGNGWILWLLNLIMEVGSISIVWSSPWWKNKLVIDMWYTMSHLINGGKCSDNKLLLGSFTNIVTIYFPVYKHVGMLGVTKQWQNWKLCYCWLFFFFCFVFLVKNSFSSRPY